MNTWGHIPVHFRAKYPLGSVFYYKRCFKYFLPWCFELLPPFIQKWTSVPLLQFIQQISMNVKRALESANQNAWIPLVHTNAVAHEDISLLVITVKVNRKNKISDILTFAIKFWSFSLDSLIGMSCKGLLKRSWRLSQQTETFLFFLWVKGQERF